MKFDFIIKVVLKEKLIITELEGLSLNMLNNIEKFAKPYLNAEVVLFLMNKLRNRDLKFLSFAKTDLINKTIEFNVTKLIIFTLVEYNNLILEKLAPSGLIVTKID